mgnify:CR=1 FL=1
MKKSKSLIFTTLLAFAMVFTMMFATMPNNIKSVYASGGEIVAPQIISVGDVEVDQETNMGGAPAVLVGQQYSAQVYASGGELTYSAGAGEYMKLPEGLSIDSETGLISGICTAEIGSYNCIIKATNVAGEASVVIGIIVGDNSCIPEITTGEGSLGQTYKDSNSQFIVSATENNANYSIYDYKETATYNVTEPITPYAIWDPPATSLTATYTGTILAGTTINPSDILITLNYSDSSTEPVNAGAVEYWYNGQQITNPIAYVFGVELIGNLNITIKYEGLETTMAVQIVGHAITFNANGGTGEMTATEYVGAYTLPANGFTAPTGQQFKGWSTSANGNVIEGTTINITADTELFAIWEDTQTPPINPDEPEDTNKGLEAGAIIGIVLASLVVLGTGGFALVWFVIKKKSWADLIAVFKKK